MQQKECVERFCSFWSSRTTKIRWLCWSTGLSWSVSFLLCYLPFLNWVTVFLFCLLCVLFSRCWTTRYFSSQTRPDWPHRGDFVLPACPVHRQRLTRCDSLSLAWLRGIIRLICLFVCLFVCLHFWAIETLCVALLQLVYVHFGSFRWLKGDPPRTFVAPKQLASKKIFCAVPSFSGGEMIWLDSLVVSCLCAAALCDVNGIYTSLVFRRNECCCHVRRAVVLETDSLSGARRYFLVVQYWGDSEWPFCFTCCFAVFVVSPLCFQKALSFCELSVFSLFQGFTSFCH